MHRDDKPALIAFALMLAAILAIAALEVGFRYSTANPPAQERTAGVDQESQAYGPPRSTEDGHFLGDSLAQWIMAGFTALATVVSAVAVKLVNDTLKTSRDASSAAVNAVTAANAANDLMRQDQRPWVDLSVEYFVAVDLKFDSASAYLKIANVGQTPALDIRLVAYPYITRWVGPDPALVNKVKERTIATADDTAVSSGVVFPGGHFFAVAGRDFLSTIEPAFQFDKGPVRLAVIFVCLYRSSRSEKFFHTAIAATAWEKLDTSSRPFDMDAGPYGTHNITFETDHRLTSVS